MFGGKGRYERVKQKKAGDTEAVLYRLGLISIVMMLLLFGIVSQYAELFQRFSIPCIFHAVTGYYCPGCGGTRAVLYFLHGHFIKSFIYHPLIPYLGLGGGIFMISQTIARLSKGRVKGMKFRNIYAYIMGIIIVVQFIIKNVVLYVWGYHMI